MSWTAIVPLKQSGERKTRLSSRLSFHQRTQLAELMARHVLNCLDATPEVTRIVILSASALPHAPFAWVEDLGRGLNIELEGARALLGAAKTLVIHGDLPLLTAEDIGAMLTAASQSGAAIAPDRHGEGTNALALADAEHVAFAFGEGSCARHLVIRPGAALVRRLGLSHDVDTPDDLDVAVAAGFTLPVG